MIDSHAKSELEFDTHIQARLELIKEAKSRDIRTCYDCGAWITGFPTKYGNFCGTCRLNLKRKSWRDEYPTTKVAWLAGWTTVESVEVV